MRRRRFIQTLLGAKILAAYPGFALASGTQANPHVLFLQRKHKDYDTYRQVFNKGIECYPHTIAACFSQQGVEQAIAMARQLGLAIAIKSGGHSFEGFSVNEGGLVIDLTNMNAHTLLDNGRLVTDPATRLLQLYQGMLPKGRILPSGSCGMVGIAGITLGGGYGLFAREHGLTCDYLQQATLLDAQGHVHTAEAGSDLLWALRGGGNGHFGVVTQLQFSTEIAPQKMWRHVFKAYKLNAARAVQILRHWFSITADLANSAFSAFVLNHRSLTILVTNTAPQLDKAMQQRLQQLEKITDKRYKDKQEPLLQAVKRYYGRLSPLYFKNASAGFYRDFSSIETAVASVFELVTQNKPLLFQVNTLGGAIKSSGSATDSAYAHREFNYLAEVQSYWQKQEQSAAAIKVVAQIQAQLWRHGVREHYVNYPDLGIKDWQQAYYGEQNYKRLQAIKRRYDPDNLFQYAQSIR